MSREGGWGQASKSSDVSSIIHSFIQPVSQSVLGLFSVTEEEYCMWALGNIGE